jgi:hypothetical protein
VGHRYIQRLGGAQVAYRLEARSHHMALRGQLAVPPFLSGGRQGRMNRPQHRIWTDRPHQVRKRGPHVRLAFQSVKCRLPSDDVRRGATSGGLDELAESTPQRNTFR